MRFTRFFATESGTKRMSRSSTGWSGSWPRNMRFRFSEIIVRPPFCSRISTALPTAAFCDGPQASESACTTVSPCTGSTGKPPGRIDIADHIDETGAAHLHRVAGAQLGIVIDRSCRFRWGRAQRGAAFWDRSDERCSPAGRHWAKGRTRRRSDRAVDGERCRDRRPGRATSPSTLTSWPA